MVSETELLQLKASHYLRLAKEYGLKKEQRLGKGQYRAMKRLYEGGQYENVIATFRGCRSFRGTIGIDDDFIDNGPYEEWNYDGKTLLVTGYLKDGLGHGERIDWSAVGRKLKVTPLVDGKIDGELYLFDDREVVREKKTYCKGVINGEHTIYSGGNLVFRKNYVNGKPDGPQEEWYTSGKVRRVGAWVNGKWQIYAEYWENGNRQTEREYYLDSLFQYRKYKNDSLIEEQTTLIGGAKWIRRWDESGNLIKDEVMK